MNRLLSQVSVPIVNEFPRVWKVISPDALSASLQDYLAERLSQDEVWAIQESVRTSDGPELTRMVFGMADATKQAGVFPIPLPGYGMGYL